MEIARLTENWQVTIPEQIRKKLNLKKGDKIVFVESNNSIIIVNSSIAAIEKLQAVMEGEADKAGITNEDDVLSLCSDVRKELYENQYADND